MNQLELFPGFSSVEIPGFTLHECAEALIAKAVDVFHMSREEIFDGRPEQKVAIRAAIYHVLHYDYRFIFKMIDQHFKLSRHLAEHNIRLMDQCLADSKNPKSQVFILASRALRSNLPVRIAPEITWEIFGKLCDCLTELSGFPPQALYNSEERDSHLIKFRHMLRYVLSCHFRLSPAEVGALTHSDDYTVRIGVRIVVDQLDMDQVYNDILARVIAAIGPITGHTGEPIRPRILRPARLQPLAKVT